MKLKKFKSLIFITGICFIVASYSAENLVSASVDQAHYILGSCIKLDPIGCEDLAIFGLDRNLQNGTHPAIAVQKIAFQTYCTEGGDQFIENQLCNYEIGNLFCTINNSIAGLDEAFSTSVMVIHSTTEFTRDVFSHICNVLAGTFSVTAPQ